MSPVLEWLNSSLKKIEHAFFKDADKVEDADTKPMGDGQIVVISDINRVTLTISKKNGEKKKLQAIIKMEAAQGPGKEMAASCNAFTTEILMYGDVLKLMANLMSEKNQQDNIWADCYHCGDNKLLLQDLCEEGYRVVPTHQFLDSEHTLLVMKAIGRFHGMSMVLKERGQLKTELIQVPYYARKLPMMDVMYKQAVIHLTKSMKEKWEPEWASVAEKLENYLEKPGEVLFNSWKSSKDKWTVLNHGDFTMRNMLFYYQHGQTKPGGIKFVDFQMCHYSNLANDLAQLLYSSVRPLEREENMDLFLRTYLDSLSSTVKLYKCEAPLPNLNDLKDSLRCLSPFIVTNFLITIPFFILAGKQDLQKKTDEYMEKYGNSDDFLRAMENSKDENMMDFEDEDVRQALKSELQRCIKENIF